jgi:hypothetical protein
MSSTPLLAYAAARDALLADIVRALSADDRFVAAWLTGSFGRDQGDAVSDLDLTVVVTDAQRDMLCARPWMVGAGTTAKRLAVIRLFGEPAVLHENHYNAPEGGSFTFTLYAGSALMVDWVFVPFSDARRPAHARPLFAKAEILPQPPPTLGARPQRSAVASERVSFFWMLAAVAAKRRARGDVVDFHVLLDHARRVADEIQAQVSGEPPAYRPAPPLALAASPAEQAQALRVLCRQVLDRMPAVEALGGHVPPSPMGEIEALLSLVA